MKQKKRDREVNQDEKFDVDPVANDHELFLQAFEKPTQIYRYLRARHMVLPTFLHRCLSFMKKRSSRTNKRRLAFSVDTMLKDAETRQRRTGGESYRPDFLNISFTEFCPRSVRGVKGPVHVDVALLKICPNRRKENLTTSSEDLGVITVPLDSAPNASSQSKVISVGSEHFSTNPVPAGGVAWSGGRSYVLSIRVSCSQCKTLNGYHQDEPAPPKRARLSSSSRQSTPSAGATGNYTAELTIYDRYRRCLLTDGEYELSLTEEGAIVKSGQWETVTGNQSQGPFEHFSSQPSIKFRVSWSRTAGGPTSRSCTQAENGIDNNNTYTVLQEVLNLTKSPAVRMSPTKMRENLVLNTNGVANGLCQKVYYQFSYNCYLRQQTEARYDYHCPWCLINCRSLYPLLKHLRLSHARFNFSYSPSALGSCIEVSVNECYDGGYVGNPQDSQSNLGFAYCRLGPVQRTPLTHVLVVRPKRPAPSLSEFTEEEECETVRNKQIIQGHNRLYYHTVTNRPIKPHEIDEDSEGENDPDWLRQKTVLMIDEFTDVNGGEKEIMKMWNIHVMKYNYVGDCQLAAACRRFIDENGHIIVDKNLQRNLIAHLVNLNDTGLIGTDTVLATTLQMYALEGRS